jgi:hypothetical protein
MLAMLLATTSICRANAIWRDSPISCAFLIIFTSPYVPEPSRFPKLAGSPLTLQKPCQGRKMNEINDLVLRGGGFWQELPRRGGKCCPAIFAAWTVFVTIR